MEEYPVQQYVEKMRQDQIERYHQEALKHGTEEQWQKNLAKTQEETGIEPKPSIGTSHSSNLTLTSCSPVWQNIPVEEGILHILPQEPVQVAVAIYYKEFTILVIRIQIMVLFTL